MIVATVFSVLCSCVQSTKTACDNGTGELRPDNSIEWQDCLSLPSDRRRERVVSASGGRSAGAWWVAHCASTSPSSSPSSLWPFSPSDKRQFLATQNSPTASVLTIDAVIECVSSLVASGLNWDLMLLLAASLKVFLAPERETNIETTWHGLVKKMCLFLLSVCVSGCYCRCYSGRCARQHHLRESNSFFCRPHVTASHFVLLLLFSFTSSSESISRGVLIIAEMLTRVALSL